MSPVRALAVALCVLLAAAACRSAAPIIDAADNAVPAVAAIFTGTLPCADCSGIRTDITLFTVTPGRRSEGSFSLVEHYLGTRTGDRTFRRQGRWVTLRGTMGDPDATVYQLTAEDRSRVVNLKRIDDDEARFLGDDQQRVGG